MLLVELDKNSGVSLCKLRWGGARFLKKSLFVLEGDVKVV